MSTYHRDLLERVVSTYIETFIGLLIVAWGTSVDLAAIQAAAIAAVPAALSALKSALAERYAPDAVSPASFAKD